MMRQSQLDAIRSTLSELTQAQVTVALCLDQLQGLVASDVILRSGDEQVPRADESTFCINWRNRRCRLGHTRSFRLFTRLLRRVDHYISYEHLMRDVWGGDVRSPDTVRSAIRELKFKLRQARMEKIARAIHGQGRHYGLILRRF